MNHEDSLKQQTLTGAAKAQASNLSVDGSVAAQKIAALNGRDWADMGNYEREQYEDEARKIECDCCGARFAADDGSFIPMAMGAGCDTSVCNECLDEAAS